MTMTKPMSEEVVEAYRNTGLTPIRRATMPCATKGCGFTALYLACHHDKLGSVSHKDAEEWVMDWAWETFGAGCRNGFIAGFDGRDRKTDHFMLSIDQVEYDAGYEAGQQTIKLLATQGFRVETYEEDGE